MCVTLSLSIMCLPSHHTYTQTQVTLPPQGDKLERMYRERMYREREREREKERERERE